MKILTENQCLPSSSLSCEQQLQLCFCCFFRRASAFALLSRANFVSSSSLNGRVCAVLDKKKFILNLQTNAFSSPDCIFRVFCNIQSTTVKVTDMHIPDICRIQFMRQATRFGVSVILRQNILEKMAPRDGFEPPAKRLTVACSTAELPGNNLEKRMFSLSEKLYSNSFL